MFSPEYTEVDSTRFSLDIETFSNHLEYGKVDLQVSSLHNSGAFFFFSFHFAHWQGVRSVLARPRPPNRLTRVEMSPLVGKGGWPPPTVFTNLPLPRPRGGGGTRTLFIIPSAEMQNHFCDSFSIIMKGD